VPLKGDFYSVLAITFGDDWACDHYGEAFRSAVVVGRVEGVHQRGPRDDRNKVLELRFFGYARTYTVREDQAKFVCDEEPAVYASPGNDQPQANGFIQPIIEPPNIDEGGDDRAWEDVPQGRWF
jgi:hypothetical protein